MLIPILYLKGVFTGDSRKRYRVEHLFLDSNLAKSLLAFSAKAYDLRKAFNY